LQPNASPGVSGEVNLSVSVDMDMDVDVDVDVDVGSERHSGQIVTD